MGKHIRLRRLVALLVSGGCLCQFVGCASGLVPVLASFVESAIFIALVRGAGSR